MTLLMWGVVIAGVIALLSFLDSQSRKYAGADTSNWQAFTDAEDMFDDKASDDSRVRSKPLSKLEHRLSGRNRVIPDEPEVVSSSLMSQRGSMASAIGLAAVEGLAGAYIADNWMSSSSDSDMGFDYDSTTSLMQDDMGTGFDSDICGSINPANGLPMVGCVDVEGNPYGTDSDMFEDSLSSSWDDMSSTSSFDDGFSLGFDDSFSSSSFDDY